MSKSCINAYKSSGEPVCLTDLFCSSTIKAELAAEGANSSFIANIAELSVPPWLFLLFFSRLMAGIPTARAIAKIELKTSTSSMVV